MTANIVAFPLCRQRRLVSGIARVLQSKQGDDATWFWRRTARGLLRQQMLNGIVRVEAEGEVRDLFWAVLAQIDADAA